MMDVPARELVGLTERQAEAYRFIAGEIRSGRPSPSFAEIQEAIGLRSKNGVHRIVHALAERGRVTYLRHRARSIELTADAHDAASEILHRARRLIVEGDADGVPAQETLTEVSLVLAELGGGRAA